MRIARPIPPAVESVTLTSLRELGAVFADVRRARNVADVAMASNLRRSRPLARRESAR